ncbi:hypothetical protein SJZ58_003858 [Salmonella enterica]|nr:hypothetical protein [Salmonella enterica]
MSLKLTCQSLEKQLAYEDILNQIRRIREITEERSDREFLGISGVNVRNLDVEIYKNIYNLITGKEAGANLTVPKKFFAWLNMQNRDFSKEIFTTNYDLVIEKSLEAIRPHILTVSLAFMSRFFGKKVSKHLFVEMI